MTPPGSLGVDNLLNHCTACQLCVSKCPSHVLAPAGLEYGLTGIMAPMMRFDRSFCNYDCSVCSNVCPTGAILPLTMAQKHATQVGRVVFDINKCIVYTHGTSCGACAEHCPTQAVSMADYRDGLTIPTTRPEFCVGCGGCEYACPALPDPAIRVQGLAVHGRARVPDPGRAEEPENIGFGF